MQSAFCLFVSLFSLFICWAFDNSCSFRQRILQEDQTRDCGIHHEARFSPWALHSVTLRNERSGGQRKKKIYTYIHFLKKDRPPKRLTSRGGSRSAVCQPHLLTRRTSVILRDLYEHQKFHVKRCLSQYQTLVKIRESLLAFWPRFSNRLSLQIYYIYIYIYS